MLYLGIGGGKACIQTSINTVETAPNVPPYPVQEDNRPPLDPIPVQRAFQIVGVDVMDLP